MEAGRVQAVQKGKASGGVDGKTEPALLAQLERAQERVGERPARTQLGNDKGQRLGRVVAARPVEEHNVAVAQAAQDFNLLVKLVSEHVDGWCDAHALDGDGQPVPAPAQHDAKAARANLLKRRHVMLIDGPDPLQLRQLPPRFVQEPLKETTRNY